MLTARIEKNTTELCKRKAADFLRARCTLDGVLQKERGQARLYPQCAGILRLLRRAGCAYF